MAGVDSPRFLYKYFAFDPASDISLRNLRSVLIDSKLWLSAPSSFNDPFDFRADYRLSGDPRQRRKYFEDSARRVTMANPGPGRKKKIINLVRKAQDHYDRNPDLANETFLKIRDKSGVCCFSTEPRSILMWAHYSQSHTGLCLQFDVANDVEVFSLARRVAYREEFPRLIWPDEMDNLIDKVIFQKYRVWEYEQERRIAVTRFVDRGMAFASEALVGVICGHRMSEESKATLSSLLSERKNRGYKEPAAYRADPRKDQYGMSIQRISQLTD